VSFSISVDCVHKSVFIFLLLKYSLIFFQLAFIIASSLGDNIFLFNAFSAISFINVSGTLLFLINASYISSDIVSVFFSNTLADSFAQFFQF
jgi:hypothetical protein